MKGDLRSRLERLTRSGELALPQPAGDRVPRGHPRERFLFPGEESLERTVFGCCYRRELSFPLERRHGRYSLGECLDCRGNDLSLPARDQRLGTLDPSRYLFLDTETTGLSGGTGTWVFLIGLGWLDGDSFRIRQYFLRHPDEEKAMLHHFAAFAAPFGGLITFNGKAFDLPLIQTRQVLQRAPQTMPDDHLDLLICARSLWKERFPSRRLSFLERALLGFQRRDDIPGEEIPSVYFDYLRRGETGPLLRVFEHNVHDVLSMAGLLGRVSAVIASEKPAHPAESYSLGRLYHEAGYVEKAEGYYRQVTGGPLEKAALARLALLHKRRGEWAEAIALWKRLTSREDEDPEACVELAKYYEHRARDHHAALHWSERALARAVRRGGVPWSSPGHPEALRHRIRRLRAKIERQASMQSGAGGPLSSPAPGSDR